TISSRPMIIDCQAKIPPKYELVKVKPHFQYSSHLSQHREVPKLEIPSCPSHILHEIMCGYRPVDPIPQLLQTAVVVIQHFSSSAMQRFRSMPVSGQQP